MLNGKRFHLIDFQLDGYNNVIEFRSFDEVAEFIEDRLNPGTYFVLDYHNMKIIELEVMKKNTIKVKGED